MTSKGRAARILSCYLVLRSLMRSEVCYSVLKTVRALDLQYRLNNVTSMKSKMRPRRSIPYWVKDLTKFPSWLWWRTFNGSVLRSTRWGWGKLPQVRAVTHQKQVTGEAIGQFDKVKTIVGVSACTLADFFISLPYENAGGQRVQRAVSDLAAGKKYAYARTTGAQS